MTTIYGLAVDGNEGTECLIFNTDAERVDWIWRNCVEVWRDGEKIEGDDALAALRTECGDDWSIPMERGQWAEMCTISLTDHEVHQLSGLLEKLHEAEALLSDCSAMLDGEEDSVREEHTDLIERVDAYVYSGGLPLNAPGQAIHIFTHEFSESIESPHVEAFANIEDARKAMIKAAFKRAEECGTEGETHVTTEMDGDPVSLEEVPDDCDSLNIQWNDDGGVDCFRLETITIN